MTESNVFNLSQPGTFSDPLTEVCAAAPGRFWQRVVRHGHRTEREVMMTGVGPVPVRAHDINPAEVIIGVPRRIKTGRAANHFVKINPSVAIVIVLSSANWSNGILADKRRGVDHPITPNGS